MASLEKFKKIHSSYYDYKYPNLNKVFFTLSEYNQDLLYQILESSSNAMYFTNNVEKHLANMNDELILAIANNSWLREHDFVKIFVNLEFNTFFFSRFLVLKEQCDYFHKHDLINELFLSKIKTQKNEAKARFLIWDCQSFDFLLKQGQRLNEEKINKLLIPYQETILSVLLNQLNVESLKIFLPYLQD